MIRRLVFACAIAATALVGAVQLASQSPAVAGTNRCERILCIPCPDGYVLSPQGGNCCRCVKVG
jgi:hypothetical protein